MGSIFGVVGADGGGLDLHAGEALLLHLRDEVDVYALRKDIGRPAVHHGAVVQLVQYSGHGAHIRALQLQLKALPHFFQQFLGGGKGGALGPVGGGVIDPLHLYGQPPQAGEAGGGAALFIGGGILEGGVRGVAEGGLGGNGEGVLPLHAGIPGNADQGQEDVVAVFLHGVGVQGDLIGDPVGDQHPAVPVQDVPPGGLHGLGLRNAVLGAGQILRPVDHLGVIEGGAQPEQNDGQQEEHPQPPTVKLFFLHGARPLSERAGHARRVPPTWRKMDRKMR